MKETVTVPDLVKRINGFTGELLVKLTKDGNEKNIVFSPYSVFTLLLLAADASAGKTRNEIVDAVLKNHDFSQSLDLLKKYIQPDLSAEGQFSAASAVIVREDKKDSITPGYPEHIRKVFDAELFVGKDIIKAVNDWVYEKSSGMIPSIVDDSMKDMLLCLLNACPFTAGWREEYEPESIHHDDFHNRDGSASRVTMLKSRESKYIENDWFIGFEKPYAGYEFSYVVLLPKEHNQFPGTALNAFDFSACFSGRANARVNVTMPEFRITSDYNLTDIYLLHGNLRSSH